MKKIYKIIICLLIIILLSCTTVSASNDTRDDNNTINHQINKTNTITNNQIIKNNTKSTKNVDNKKKITTKLLDNSQKENPISKKSTYKKEKIKNYTKTLKTTITSHSYTYTGILDGANRTSNFIKKNNRLPAVVGIDNQNVNMNEMLYLMCKSLNSTSTITSNNYSHISSSTGTNCNNVKIYKNDYLKLSNELIKYYTTNNENPQKITINNETLTFDDAVYFYARAVAWKYNNKGTLPNYGTVIALYNNDYSTDENALISQTNQSFTINTNITKLENGNYNITLIPSQTATIHYTTNGTEPTDTSNTYTKSMVISPKTWLKFYGINKNNQKTPILTIKINGTPMAYISHKPQKVNSYEYEVELASPTQSTIYYTINGTIPTKQSTIYTKPIKIHNNTLLQYITLNNEKASPIYYYKLQNPTPYITIINNTEVENNYQTITIIGNKPGIIYYTRNGSIPAMDSKIYTPGTKINISIKTQLKTILIDDTKKQSEINNYQSPQIITLPIITVEPLLFDSGDNTQNILFNMKNRQELYYTIDGTNPKNSTTTKKITSGDGSQYNPEIYHIISNKTILKYYVKDELGLVSEVYTYRSIRNQYEKATITILNTTPLYKKGAINTRQEEKIKIQTNKRGITLLKNDGEVYYYDDIILNNTSTVLFKQDTETTIKEYTLQKGLRTRMNYTYTMNIPYQILKITINSKTIINLNNQTVINNLKNDKYYSYDYQTNTYKITTNKTLNKPGTLIYLTDKNKNITIRTYDYCYGDVNQVSIVKEWMAKNTIKISVINNCIKNEIASLYLPVLTYIDCYFKSNDFYRFDYVKDYLSLSKLENNGALESVETYILTNKKITYDILKEWIQKYPSYNRSVYKSCYGTFLTGLTHLYLHNAMISAIDYKINVTSYVSQNTQMCVFITYSGQTIVNIGDGYHGTRIISNNETNIRIHKFLNGYICSYLEDLVLYMAGDNGSGSACTYFMQDVFNYKTINFTYDNNTGNMEIHTQNNNDYYIRIYPDGSAGWYVSNNRNEFKTIKSSTNSNLTFNEISMVNEMSGGIGTKNYGFNYESSATELMVDRISDLDKILSWGSKNLNLTGFEWEVINTAENMGGSVLIGTGVVLLCASGVGLIPIALIAGGSTLCYFATGVNGVNDLVNPYYAIKASWSISEAIVTSVIGGPFGGLEEVTAVSMTEGLYMEIKESMRVALARNNLDRIKNIPLAIEDYIVGKFHDWELDYVLNHTRRYVPS